MLIQIDHVNVRTAQMENMISWYSDVLGLSQGARPGFPFGGAWLYLGDHPVIHLVDCEKTEQPGTSVQLEHVAFTAQDHDQFVAHLRKKNVQYSEQEIDDPVAQITQVHIRDPDGNHLHVDFPRL